MEKAISVVINTYNEAKNLERLLESIRWASEIVICDMHSTDNTIEIAKKYKARVFYHKKEEFVEPARNFAISQSSNEWVLILDPDEEIGDHLKDRLIQIAERMEQIDYLNIPRKNIIFNKWMQASMWWPDYNIRFFRKDKVKWSDKIHSKPETKGVGLDLPAEEDYAIVHHNYDNLSDFLLRMIRYTKVQSEELVKDGYKFQMIDLIKKPFGEFLSRFFANQGYKDGLHGFALSMLQAFSHLVVYVRLWEKEGFKERNIDLKDLKLISGQLGSEVDYWFNKETLPKNPFKRFVQKIKYKAKKT